MDGLSIASLIVCSVSLLVAIGSTIFAIISFNISHRHDLKTKLDLVFENVIVPLTHFTSDADFILDKDEFCDTEELEKQEQILQMGFQRLRYYSVARNFPYLEIFSIVSPKDEETKKKSFAFNLFLLENNYLIFRRNHRKGKITEQDQVVLKEYVRAFRSFIVLCSQNTLNVLFEKKPNEKVLEAYYSKLSELKIMEE